MDRLGQGERHAESFCLLDMNAIVGREALTVPDQNFQFPDDCEAL
jgi:hypothetical protein